MNVTLVDMVFEVYLEERTIRRLGENSGVRSPSLVWSTSLSACHQAPPTTIGTRKGRREVCSSCLKPCTWQTQTVPRGEHGQGDGFKTMVLKPQRSCRRDAEDERRAESATRYIAASRLIEPRPRGFDALRWARDLVAWEVMIRFGVTRGVALASTSGLGAFTRYQLYQGTKEAREVVSQRALRDPSRVRAVLGR